MKSSRWVDWLLKGFVALVVLFSIFPLFIIFPVSLNPEPVLGMPESGLTLYWYVNALTNDRFIQAFVLSISLASIATVSSLVMGSLVAWALSQPSFPASRLVEAYFLSPLILARVVYGVAMLIVLTRLDLIRTLPGLAIAHSVIVMPYVVRVVGASLLGVRSSLEESARILGARQWQVLWYIVLPLVRPGLLAAAVFAFITSLDEFTMTVFLVGPGMTTLPIAIFRYVQLIVDPTVAAISTLLIILSVALILIVERTLGIDKVLNA
jgi:putative spermidine/putrescine transport system permease protein